MLGALWLLNVILMITMPLALGWLIKKRLAVSWRLFFIGAATFILVQIAHIPFNYVAFSMAADWLGGLSDSARLWAIAIFAGLSAGVFEEGGRYIVYRNWARDARTWSKGVMLGAGHGGAEAIIFGLLAGINVLFFLGYRAGYFSALVPTGEEAQLRDVIDALFAVPWYRALFGAFERLSAMSIQIALSLLVLQVFTRGNILWLFVAIGWHALIDALAVYSLATLGAEITELIVGLFAIIAILIVFLLKTPDPVEQAPEPLPEAGPATAIEIEVTNDMIDDSRYMS
jgi:uncharacterized membrane protein YhfC